MYELWLRVVGEGDYVCFGSFPSIDDARGFADTLAVFVPPGHEMPYYVLDLARKLTTYIGKPNVYQCVEVA